MKKFLFAGFIVTFISSVLWAQTLTPGSGSFSPTPSTGNPPKHKKGKKQVATATPSVSPTPTEPAVKPGAWVPPPSTEEYVDPKTNSLIQKKTMRFSVDSNYINDASGSRLFAFGDILAHRNLDENSTFADLQVRFEKALSTSDTPNAIDLRLARITYFEPWFQITVGRFDMFPVVTPMTFFGNYPMMGLHRVDGAMAVIPLFLKLGIENYETYTVPPTAISIFYSPSLLEGQNVVLDTSQAFVLTQARFKTRIAGLETTFRANFGWTSTDYFNYSSLNGGFTYSFAADLVYQNNISLYGEFGVQNAAYFDKTDVVGAGLKVQRLGTWGPFSLDQVVIEGQIPLEQSLFNEFSGGNPLDSTQASLGQISYYGGARVRVRNIFIDLGISNNLNDFTLGRLQPNQVTLPFTGSFGPGRETDRLGVPLKAASYSSPAFIVSIGEDF